MMPNAFLPEVASVALVVTVTLEPLPLPLVLLGRPPLTAFSCIPEPVSPMMPPPPPMDCAMSA